MKKILIMASLFWPQKKGGGPPVSIMNLVRAIHGDYELHIISNNYEVNGDAPLEGVTEGKNVLPFGTTYYLSRETRTYSSVLKLMEQIDPDIIYQNSFFSHKDVFPVLQYQKRHPKTTVIITPRGEFQQNALRYGWLKKRLYILALKGSGLLRNVQWQFAAQSECDHFMRVCRLKTKKLYIIPNLTYGGDADPNRRKTAGHVRLCFVGRIHPHKNLLYALDVLSRVQGEVEFDIYGSCEEAAYYDACQQSVKTLPQNIRCCFKGCVDNDCIHRVIGSYHGLFLPTKSEAYGQSLVEAMLTEVPVITSTGTPWTDINQSGAGYALELKNGEAFVQAVNRLVQMDHREFTALAGKAKAYINDKLQTENTIAAYHEMFGQ